MWTPKNGNELKKKTRPISLEQPTNSPVNASPDATPQEAERDHDDKRRRIDEPVSPVFTVAQDEVLASSPVHFDSETKNDEIAVDVPLPEEPTEMKWSRLDHRRSILHSLAWCATSATAQGGKDEPLVTCRKT